MLHICIVQMCTAAIRGAPVSDVQQLIQASRLYYELGETQSRVAELLGVTRPQVSRLLKRARAEGIVEIRIVDQASVAVAGRRASSASGSGSHAVHLAPALVGPEEVSRRMIGRLGGRGAAGRDPRRRGRRRRRRRLDLGGRRRARRRRAAPRDRRDGRPAVRRLLVQRARPASRSGASPTGSAAFRSGLLAPGLVDDPATKRSLVAHAGVRRILDLWDRLDVAAFGIGGPAWSAAAFGDATMPPSSSAAGAVGEVLVAPVRPRRPVRLRRPRATGRSRSTRASSIASRSGSASPAAPAKVRPILGALRGGAADDARHRPPTAEARRSRSTGRGGGVTRR